MPPLRYGARSTLQLGCEVSCRRPATPTRTPIRNIIIIVDVRTLIHIQIVVNQPNSLATLEVPGLHHVSQHPKHTTYTTMYTPCFLFQRLDPRLPRLTSCAPPPPPPPPVCCPCP